MPIPWISRRHPWRPRRGPRALGIRRQVRSRSLAGNWRRWRRASAAPTCASAWAWRRTTRSSASPAPVPTSSIPRTGTRSTGSSATALRLAGLYERAQRNARTIRLIHNRLAVRRVCPRPFEGLRILHLSDLHTDLDPRITHAIGERVREAGLRPVRAHRRLPRPHLRPLPARAGRDWHSIRAGLEGPDLRGPRQPRHHPAGAGAGGHGDPGPAERVGRHRAGRGRPAPGRHRRRPLLPGPQPPPGGGRDPARTGSRCCSPTPRRSIARPPTPASRPCCADTPTAVRSACPAATP